MEPAAIKNKTSIKNKTLTQDKASTKENEGRANGEIRNVHALLGATHTSALLVLKQGEVRFKEYWLGGGREFQMY